MQLNNKQTENLYQLLTSPNELETHQAFVTIEKNGFHKSLLSELFIVFKTTDNKELRNKAKDLLNKHGSNRLIDVMKKRYPLKPGDSTVAATEKTIKKNIIQYTHNSELDGIKLAKTLFRKFGLGVNYLLTETSEQQKKETIREFLDGQHFKLNHKALTQIPKELFELTEITSLDLSSNNITSIPKEIEAFKNLEVLNLSQNKLKSIHKNILKLKNLKELYLSTNEFTMKFPEVIFKLSQLEKLNIVHIGSNAIWYKELPKEICNLKNLKELEYQLGFTPSFSNYPVIGKVYGSPLNLDPLEIAYTAYDQGDNKPIHYIFKYGSKERILEILNKHYDSSTQTMTLDSVHIEQIPNEITEFKIKKLSLKNCGLGTYYGSFSHTKETLDRINRRSISRTAILNRLTDLEVLDLSENLLCEIAPLDNLQNLKEINLYRNKFEYFPKGLTCLNNLESLNISSYYTRKMIENSSESLPDEIQNLKSLKKLQIGIHGMSRNKEFFEERLKKLLPDCSIQIS